MSEISDILQFFDKRGDTKFYIGFDIHSGTEYRVQQGYYAELQGKAVSGVIFPEDLINPFVVFADGRRITISTPAFEKMRIYRLELVLAPGIRRKGL